MIVLIDSCFTQTVYGQHVERTDERQIHSMQTLHANNKKLADNTDSIVVQSYELAKAMLNNIYTETCGSGPLHMHGRYESKLGVSGPSV